MIFLPDQSLAATAPPSTSFFNATAPKEPPRVVYPPYNRGGGAMDGQESTGSQRVARGVASGFDPCCMLGWRVWISYKGTLGY